LGVHRRLAAADGAGVVDLDDPPVHLTIDDLYAATDIAA
jgi:hypothetical protein